jgi:hypothetical protein
MAETRVQGEETIESSSPNLYAGSNDHRHQHPSYFGF